jgi:integrase
MNEGLDLVRIDEPDELNRLARLTQDYLAAAKADSTRAAYRGDWEHFDAWCQEHRIVALPATPETVALYLADLSTTHKPATLRRRLTVISRAHQAAGHQSPASGEQILVTETLRGIRRTVGTAQAAKSPIFTSELRSILSVLPDSLQGIRDRALLLTGFAGGFRRCELAGLRFEDVAVVSQGLVILLRRSKSDQEAAGRKIGIPRGRDITTCPAAAFQAWKAAANLTDGPAFRKIDRYNVMGPHGLRPEAIGLAFPPR